MAVRIPPPLLRKAPQIAELSASRESEWISQLGGGPVRGPSPARGRFLVRGFGAVRRSQRPEPYRRLPAADVELAHEGEVARRIEERLTGRLRHEARRSVHGVAVNGVLELARRADVPGHEAPAVESDAHPEALAEAMLAEPAIEAGQAHSKHLARRGERPVGMVVERDRRAEDGEEAIAAVADERASLLEDRVDHLAEVLVQQLDPPLRCGRLGECREASEVGEHHRAEVAAPA